MTAVRRVAAQWSSVEDLSPSLHQQCKEDEAEATTTLLSLPLLLLQLLLLLDSSHALKAHDADSLLLLLAHLRLPSSACVSVLRCCG